jgi:glycine betaine/choline ABC-type transport system substrate-binding protein
MGRAQIVAGLILALCAGWGVGCNREQPIVVGSKNFTEQVLLGEIVAQHLEQRLGGRVDRKLNLGGTLLVHQALINGDIDLYPEYTGTALTAVLKHPPIRESGAAFASVREQYRKQFGVHWMEPLGFNNTFAMVVRGEDARTRRLETLSDAAGYSGGWILGMGYEFQQREDGLGGLLKTYRLPVKGTPKIMDLGLLYQALERGQVDMVAANATDGRLSASDLFVLRDDERYFPPYECALAVRTDMLTRRPAAEQALAELSGRFNDTAMQKLNYQVDAEHRSVKEVAKEFLRATGLQP